jgi:tetratricopeptide (TPR) repeat protein
VSLHNLGRIARERKDYTRAEEYYRKAIAIVERAFGPENPRLAITLNNIANLYRARGEYAKSLESHLQVLRISETTRGPYHPLTLTSLGNIAKTYAAQGNIEEAIKFQSRVDGVIERNIEMNLTIGSERQKLSYLNSVAQRMDRTISLNSDLAPQDPTASALAALVLLQRKGRVLDAMSESFASLRQRATPEEQALLKQFNDTAAQLARLVLNGPQGVSFEEHQKKVRGLEEQEERLEAEISGRSAEFRAGSQTVTLDAVQAAIPANAALIEFAVYRRFDPKAESNREAYEDPCYIAYVLRQKGEVRWRDLGDARALDEAAHLLRQSLGNPLLRDVRERCRAVDQKVMQPVRALVGDANLLLISPDGALNLIPFEALVDEHGRYLIQSYAVAYLTSGRDLLRFQVARTGQNPSLVLADPLFGEPDLPHPARAAIMGERSNGQKRQSITTTTDLYSVYSRRSAAPRRKHKPSSFFFPKPALCWASRPQNPASNKALRRGSFTSPRTDSF